MRTLLFTLGALISSAGSAQNYTSYFTGNTADIVTQPTGGICLMGGALENDSAMAWFLNRSNGGDVLVLRASGSNGYNNYLYTDLGVTVNSVETIVFNDATASDEAYVQQKIMQAEAIWFAGGDQWNYISYWRNTPVDSLINDALLNRNIVIGGTSAGMAIMGGYYFSAENGSVTSAEALTNPYNTYMTVDSTNFLHNAFLEDVITDTHYDSPDRKGRHIAFLGRILVDYGVAAKGIACDEYTAVCISPEGIARVYGDYPSEDDNAYFIQTNCELADPAPESCTDGDLFVWDRGGKALKVYKVKGTASGANTFDLNDWTTGSGGEWQHWSVTAGAVNETPGTAPECGLALEEQTAAFSVYPNPATTSVTLTGALQGTIRIMDVNARTVKEVAVQNGLSETIDLSALQSGTYFVEAGSPSGTSAVRIVKQ